jgi:hypothetical protein
MKKQSTGGRGVDMALARVTPQLSTATFNKKSLEAMGNPTKVIFYDLGESRVIVQPYRKSDSSVFDTLRKKKLLVNGRLFSLSVRNGTAVFRTPAWIRKADNIAAQPVAGYLIKELENCLYFDFTKPMATETVPLSEIQAVVGSQTSLIDSYEETFSRGSGRPKVEVEEEEEEPTPKKRKIKAKVKVKAKAKPVKKPRKAKPVEVEEEEEEAAAPPPTTHAIVEPEEDLDEEEWDEEDETPEVTVSTEPPPAPIGRMRSGLRNLLRKQ